VRDVEPEPRYGKACSGNDESGRSCEPEQRGNQPAFMDRNLHLAIRSKNSKLRFSTCMGSLPLSACAIIPKRLVVEDFGIGIKMNFKPVKLLNG
jgi:hypothetical protein